MIAAAVTCSDNDPKLSFPPRAFSPNKQRLAQLHDLWIKLQMSPCRSDSILNNGSSESGGNRSI